MQETNAVAIEAYKVAAIERAIAILSRTLKVNMTEMSASLMYILIENFKEWGPEDRSKKNFLQFCADIWDSPGLVKVPQSPKH
jgi:hypothetical protein